MSPATATKTAKTTEGRSAVLQRLVHKYSDGSAVALPVKAMFEDYNVRMKPFDFDRIAFFEGLYLETPDEVPPVLVEETGGKYRILDGRTRHASALNLKFKTIRAIVLKNVSETDRTLIAALSNFGGPRHMDGDDTKLTCDRLLMAGQTTAEIRVLFAQSIPYSVLEKALHHAQSDAKKRLFRQARKLLASGMNLKEASAKLDMTREQVKSFKRSFAGASGSDKNHPWSTQAKGMLGQKFKFLKIFLTAASTSWLGRAQMAELDSDEVDGLFDAWEGHAKQLLTMASSARQKHKNQTGQGN